MQVHTAHLLAIFERSNCIGSKHHSARIRRSKHTSQPLLRRIQRPYSAGSVHTPSLARVSNDTPLSAPQSGSLENLLDSSSRASLLSTESDNSECTWNGEVSKFKLGTFVSSQPSAVHTNHKMSPQEDDESTVVMDDNSTPNASQENDPVTSNHDQVGIISRHVSVHEVHSPKFAQLLFVEEKTKVHPEPIVIKPPTSSSCAWVRVQQKYRLMKQRSVEATCSPSTATTHEEVTETNKEPTDLSLVEERARVFGGIRKQGSLRRTQSFQIGPHHSANITTQVPHHV